MRRTWQIMAFIWLAGAIFLPAGPAAAQQLRLPEDLTYPETAGSPGKVTFSHQLHTALAEKCTVCHVRIFPMLRPLHQVTHSEMEAGKSCGVCHDSRTAFGPADANGCARCHVAGGKPS